MMPFYKFTIGGASNTAGAYRIGNSVESLNPKIALGIQLKTTNLNAQSRKISLPIHNFY
jgi:hypothetical protein